MKSQQIVRVAGIAALAWVGIVVGDLVYGSSGPAPDPTHLLLQLTLGPIALLAGGNALAWLAARMGQCGTEGRAGAAASHAPLAPSRVQRAHGI